jgi:hypothetical protein
MVKSFLPVFLLLLSLPLSAQESAEQPRHRFSIGPVVGFDFMTQEIRFGPAGADRVLREQDEVLPQFGLQAMYRMGQGLALVTEPAFGSFFSGIDLLSSGAQENRRLRVEKFHVLHLPLLLRKTLSEEDLAAYLIAGVDMMVLLAPEAAIRYTAGGDLDAATPVVYDLPFSRMAVQAGFGVQWQRTETLTLTADIRYRAITDEVIGGELAAIAFPSHMGVRLGLRVHFAKRKPF